MSNTAKSSIIEQTPATTNSIAENKPRPPQTNNLLEGYYANSWNGGILKPIAYKKIMAGEKITNYSLSGNIRTLTPKVPVSQKLTTTFKVFFVPNNRVWLNHDKYLAQKGGQTTTKIIEKPTFLQSQIITNSPNSFVPVTDTQLWREGFPSTYIPRIYTNDITNTTSRGMPKISILPIRGFKAIYNDMLRHKAYDSAMTEYNTDTVSTAEYNESIPRTNTGSGTLIDKLRLFVKRGRRKDSYHTNYRTQSQGKNETISPMYTDLMQHNEWAKRIAESRSQAESEQLNDWDIVAKLRGSIPISDGKVQFLGMKEIGINYTQVSQTAYNTNPEILEEFQTLGATGSFSYTEFNVSLINYHQFKEDGYIHVIAQTSADTVFETGIDRNELNVTWDSEYRPDLKELKEDTLYTVEQSGLQPIQNASSITGFKRKFSEYFKLPNCINGDMTSTPIYEIQSDGINTGNQIPLKSEFQFFEIAAERHYDKLNGIYLTKNIWQDYTDLLINKNLAIQQVAHSLGSSPNSQTYIDGPSQLFMMAIASCITNLPIDDTIKNDFKQWGEQ